MTEANPEIVEIKSNPKQKEQITWASIIQIFSAELAILLKERGENEQDLTIHPFRTPPQFDERYFVDVVAQDENHIIQEMMKLLKSKGVQASYWQIRDALKGVTVWAKEETASFSAVPYAPRRKTPAQKEAEKQAKQEKKERQQQTKKQSKNKPRKQGRKRPFMGHPSIKAAAQATGESYAYLRYQANKLESI